MLFNPVVHVISPMVVALYYALSPRAAAVTFGRATTSTCVGVRSTRSSSCFRPPSIIGPRSKWRRVRRAAHGGRFSTSVSLAISASFTLALRFLHEQHRTSGSRTWVPSSYRTKPVVAVDNPFYTFQTLFTRSMFIAARRVPSDILVTSRCSFRTFRNWSQGPSSVSTISIRSYGNRYASRAPTSAPACKSCCGISKIVVADRLAIYVNQVYGAPSEYAAWSLWLATYLRRADLLRFPAIRYRVGTARTLVTVDAELSHALLRPLDQEFWQRWYVSLSQWFRTTSTFRSAAIAWCARWYANLGIVFLVSGFGAN